MLRPLPFLLCLFASGALAQVQVPASAATEGPPVQAIRTREAPRVDGLLEEPLWTRAPVFTDFRQTFPNEGAPPSDRTELRVVYDDRYLYLGVLCHDSQPQLINRRLGRRDNPPASDRITVMLDPSRERRTAYSFSLNAGGVLQDGLITEEIQFSADWDAVWEGSAAPLPEGWSAELRIPLSALRFSTDSRPWGFNVRRELARTGETFDSSVIPRNANALVSRLGALEGLTGLRPQRVLELAPYLAARGVFRPQYSSPSQPTPRLLEPSANVGLDLRASLTSDLLLNATLNPDFGQVEADERILNLTNFERFFPEKRPFFTEGMELFLPVGANEGQSNQMLFYSRRIGLDTPLLAAGKLTGTLAPGWNLGVLDAVVTGAADPGKEAALLSGQPIDEAHPDRRLQFHPRRPLRLGLNSELPAVRPVTTHFLTAVLRRQVHDNSSVGATLAARTPLEHGDALGSNALALDWSLRTRDNTWFLLGQVDASRIDGGPPDGRLLADGTRLRPGDLGVGGIFRGGKLGGEPWRFLVAYEYTSPRLDLNLTGFLETQNQQLATAQLQYIRISRVAFFEELTTTLALIGRWTTDGRLLSRGHEVLLNAGGILRGLHALSCTWGGVFERVDVREISGTGTPLQWPANTYVQCTGETNPRLAFSLSGTVFFKHTLGRTPSRSNPGAQLTADWRPHERLQTQLVAGSEGQLESPRYLETLPGGRYLFADLDSRFLSLTLRQSLILTPRLTLQAYAQLFSNYGHHGPFYEGAPEGGRVLRPEDLSLVPFSGETPDFRGSNLNLNLVLRWEYRSGSTLFLVFTRAQDQFPLPVEELSVRTLRPVRLLEGPANDVLLLKWTHRLEL